jgi:hypothetical protein
MLFKSITRQMAEFHLQQPHNITQHGSVNIFVDKLKLCVIQYAPFQQVSFNY